MKYIPFAFPGVPGVQCVFQVRELPNGGNRDLSDNISLTISDDERTVLNRKELARACGLERLAEMRQVHGDVTIFEPDAVSWDRDPRKEADGMATSRPGIGLMIKTADCQPIMLAHRSGRYIAALHAGWRANRNGYPQKAVHQFCAHYGIEPGDVFAVRGPSLGPAHAEFTKFEEEWGDAFRPWFDEVSHTMDLWGLTRSQLCEAGLEKRNIMGIDVCTFSMPEYVYSFRRERACGRQGSVIWIKKGREMLP